jgi:hypothetical protein
MLNALGEPFFFVILQAEDRCLGEIGAKEIGITAQDLSSCLRKQNSSSSISLLA